MALTLKSISYDYASRNGGTPLLSELDLSFEAGEIHFISGDSGCGKSTLLFLIGGLLTPEKGEIAFNGRTYFSASDSVSEMADFRKDFVSFVFQDFNLLQDLTVFENLRITGLDEAAIASLLAFVKLDSLSDRAANTLSGGEQQRLAIARALALNKQILLFDEPTANIDEESEAIIYDLLERIASERIVIVTTHDKSVIHQRSSSFFAYENHRFVARMTQRTSPRASSDQADSFRVKDEAPVPRLTRGIGLKYFLSLFKRKKALGISSLISLAVLLSIFATFFSSTCFDAVGPIYDSFVQSGIDYCDIGRVIGQNRVGANLEIRTGKYLFDDAKENQNADVFDCVSVSIDPISGLNLIVVDSDVSVSGAVLPCPEENRIWLSPFMKTMLGEATSATAKFNKYGVSAVLGVDYYEKEIDASILNHFYTGSLSNAEKDVVDYSYKCGFIAKGTVFSILAQSSFTDFIPSPNAECDDLFTQNDVKVPYKTFSGEEFLCGAKPEKENEIAVSSAYFDRYLKAIDPASEGYAAAIGKTLFNRNTSELPVKPLYFENMNMFEVSRDFIITGVFTDTVGQSSILLNPGLFLDYAQAHIHYGDSIRCNVSSKAAVDALLQNAAYSFGTYSAKTVYGYRAFLNTNFQIVMIVFEAVILLLSAILFVNLFKSLLIAKVKELCVCYINGVPKKDIVFALLIPFSVIVLLIAATSFGLAGACLSLINAILASPDVLDIGFSLLFFNGHAVWITVIAVILALALCFGYLLANLQDDNIAHRLKGNK